MSKAAAQKKPTTATKKDSSQSTLERISDYLRLGIRSGRFVPGQHLLESDMTRQLGCSRGSLRPAMIHLAAEGVITLSRFKGARISVLSRKSIYDLLDVLETLVTLLATKACDNIDEAGRARLTEASQALEEAGQGSDSGTYLQRRKEFYDTLFDISGNNELRRAIPLFRADLLRVQLQMMTATSARPKHSQGYATIAKAVISGDNRKVSKAVKDHVQRTRQLVDELPETAFPDLDD